jgi:U3 small nucleolar RNA-associated protein 22
MKRKRGPAPDGKQSRGKREVIKKVEELEGRHEERGSVQQDTASFEGFSSADDDEELEEQGEEPKLDTTAVNGSASKTKQRGRKAAPTQEELMDLLFRSSSFQSNLFKLQVDELLSEIRVKYDKMDRVERFLHQLKEILTSIPESQEQLVIPHFIRLTQVTCFRDFHET